MNAETAERFVQVGMRAVIRDIQEYINDPDNVGEFWGMNTFDAEHFRAYLLAMLITSGAYDDADDPFGALRHQLIDPHE